MASQKRKRETKVRKTVEEILDSQIITFLSTPVCFIEMFTFAANIILALCLLVQKPNWPPMKNYQCKKCGILIKTERQPNAFNCRAGNYHDWNDLGEVGCENYRCKKCGLLVESKSAPSSFGCTAGGYHNWQDLCPIGTDVYQCKKCGILLYASKSPNAFDCPSGGYHQWNKMN